MDATPPWTARDLSSDGPPDLEWDRPHTARVYDVLLDGKTHYAVDREAARRVLEAWPGAKTAARENRAYMHRVTRVLAREYGIRQWLDVGTGIPTSPNLHEIAQSVAPEARVVYVDHDPIVLAHARALLTSTPEGRTAYIQADVTDPSTILEHPDLAGTLDLDRPVALSMHALLHFVEAAHEVVGRLLAALPAGSVLTVTHGTFDFNRAAMEQVAAVYRESGIGRERSKEEVAGFFEGLEMIDPGLVPPHRWRPETPQARLRSAHGGPTEAEVGMWAGVGVKR